MSLLGALEVVDVAASVRPEVLLVALTRVGAVRHEHRQGQGVGGVVEGVGVVVVAAEGMIDGDAVTAAPHET